MPDFNSTEELINFFISEELNEEYLKFNRIETKLSKYADIHGLRLLEQIINPDTEDNEMICSAQHDEYFLRPSIEDLFNAKVTKAQVIDLHRCGVRYSTEYDSLAFFA